jgi:UDP-N-acetylmuramyl-tripeptide synthetase
VSDASAAATDALGWLRQVAPSVFADRRDLRLDSRCLKRGDVFLAVRGNHLDGRRYLPAAAASGAAAALVDADGWNEIASSSTTSILPTRAVKDLRSVMGPLAAEFYRRPSEHLLSIGVTGTNGKTSSTQWIAQLLTRADRRCAVIGTIGIGFADEALNETSLTTPDPVSLQREVRALLDAGAQALAMEVSSIGLEQGRLNGMKIDVALFTNLTRDHLDYHGTMQRYEAAKSLLFDWPTLSHAVINLDDAAGRRLIPRLAERGVDVIGYSASNAGEKGIESPIAHRLSARAIRATAHGLAFEVDRLRARGGRTAATSSAAGPYATRRDACWPAGGDRLRAYARCAGKGARCPAAARRSPSITRKQRKTLGRLRCRRRPRLRQACSDGGCCRARCRRCDRYQ